MLNDLFPNPQVQAWLKSGSAGPVIQAYGQSLQAAGCTASTMRQLLHAAAHLGHWLEEQGLSLAAIDDAMLERFQNEHLPQCHCRRSRSGSHEHTALAAARFRKYLRSVGVVPSPPKVIDEREKLTEEFLQWMECYRGVTGARAKRYLSCVNSVMDALGTDPARYDVEAIRQFVLNHLSRYKSSYVKAVGSTLRTFLRFLIAKGRCPSQILDAVPRTANWTLSEIPRHLPPDVIETVVGTVGTHAHSDLRDRAMLLLLARLGLRAGDLVHLKLSDFDWSRGLVRVLGKGRREAWLPLPQEVGDAVLEYLQQARKASVHQNLFLSRRSPFRPLRSIGAVVEAVRQALAQAGVQPPRGVKTHLFRHSLARRLLEQNVPLEGIGVILRHRTVETTAKYAKLDIASLRSVAQPWPETLEVMPC
jgi:integrase/recombinase XerD